MGEVPGPPSGAKARAPWTGGPDDRADGRVGWVEGASAGPLLLCVGGVHGNEPAGVRALEMAVPLLRSRRTRVAGDFVAVVGNVQALAAGRRYLAYDLNRVWTASRIGEAVARAEGDGRAARRPEDHEVVRMLAILEEVAARARGPVHVLDLHTTSSGGGAFSTSATTPRHRRFGGAIPVPMVRHLNHKLQGTLTTYLDRFGYTAAVFESGQHREPAAVDRALGAIWLAVRASGLLGAADAPEATAAYRELQDEWLHLPRVVELTYRHPIAEGDGYLTNPGFRNFQPVRAGDVIGRDRNGDVVAPRSGRILMPLYQQLGEDGFFVVSDTVELDAETRSVECVGAETI